MARNLLGWLCLSIATCCLGVTGCGRDTGVFKPFQEVLRMKEPVRIGITRVQLNPVQSPWDALVKAMEKKLARRVQVVYYRPSQIRSQLNKGYLDLAILSATDYAEIGEDSCVLLAKPINTLGQTSRQGLIIAKKDSKVKTLDDLKDRRFAFGPPGDAVSHLAAAYALLEAGLRPNDIQRELLPIPMSRRHHLDSFEVAKAVAYEPLLEAGAVDEVAWSTWPAKTTAVAPVATVLQSVSQDRYRIVARTVTLPEGPIVASKKADPALVAAVKEYLLSHEIPAKALKPMDWQGFVAVEPGEYEPVVNMVRRLHEAGWVREEMLVAPTTAPASEPAAEAAVEHG